MAFHHPKLKLTPLLNTILWFVEDQDNVSLATLVNELQKRFSDKDATELLEETGRAITLLLELEFVALMGEALDRKADLHEIVVSPQDFKRFLPLKEVLRWRGHSNSGTWFWNEELGGAYVIGLHLTQKGVEALGEPKGKL